MWTTPTDGTPATRPEAAHGVPPTALRRKKRVSVVRRGCSLALPAGPGEAPVCIASSCCGCPRLVDWL